MPQHLKQQKLPAHKMGDDRHSKAIKWRKVAKNFAQSRDVREDRGRRKSKLVGVYKNR